MKIEKQLWKKIYSIVLIVNVIYILIFYFITQFFTK